MNSPRQRMSLFLTAAFLFLLPSFGTAQMVGFESEFATVGFMEVQWGEKQLELSKKMLEIVKGHFDGKGEIVSVPWSKYPEKNIQILAYKDPRGRMWNIDPEAVNTTGLDGVEFVTPALDSKEDIERYSQIMQDLRRSKLVMGGLRSSNHITVDVSHLTKDPNNISQLVDLILTIENHWVEIYRFYDPIRYGTIINRFSVPLALDQQDLLHELAALPKSQRTYAKVRSLFLKYDQKENELRNPDDTNAVRKWKYRAANYGKLFRLSANTPGISAIEFRVGDLEFGSRIQEKVAFMQKLVNSKNLDKKFLAPFGNKVLSWQEGTEVLKKSELQADFLKALVTEEKLAQIQRKTPSVTIQMPQGADLVDMNRPVEVNGKAITFGFEAEFAHGKFAKKIMRPDWESPQLTKFPYLDAEVSNESTGNLEIRSVGGEKILAEVLGQMEEVRSTLNQDMRGFHMHMRIPPEIIAKHDPQVLEAWISNISDSIFAWRLQNRRHFFALKTTTLARQSVSKIEERGPVRLIKMDDGTWDFEIRGYMASHEMIGAMAQKVATGLMNPEWISTLIVEQKLLGLQKFTLEEGLEKYNQTYLKRSLTNEEKSIAGLLSGEVEGQGLLPLYDYASLFDADPIAKRKIQDATLLFFKETSTVIRNYANMKYESDEELGKQFRWRVKRWAQAIDLQSLLEKRILFKAVDKDGMKTSAYKYDRESVVKNLTTEREFKPIEQLFFDGSGESDRISALHKIKGSEEPRALRIVEIALKDESSKVRAVALNALSEIPGAAALALAESAFKDKNPVIRIYVLGMLHERTEEKALVMIEKGVKSKDVDERRAAARALAGRTDPKSLKLIEKLMADSDMNVKKSALVALRNRTEDKIFKLFEKALDEKDVAIRKEAIFSLGQRSDPLSLKVIEKAYANTNEEVRQRALEFLTGRTDAESLVFMEKTFKTEKNPKLRNTLAAALSSRKGKEALPLIEAALNDASQNVRATAAEGLKDRSDTASLKLIAKALADTNENVRLQAAQALAGRLEDPQAYEINEKLQNDPDQEVRLTGLKNLAPLRDEKSMRLIEKYAHKSGHHTRVILIKILESRNEPAAVKILENLLDNDGLTGNRGAILKVLFKKFDDQKFVTLYNKEIKRKGLDGVYITEMKRIYLERFGSLNAGPSTAPLCSSIFTGGAL